MTDFVDITITRLDAAATHIPTDRPLLREHKGRLPTNELTFQFLLSAEPADDWCKAFSFRWKQSGLPAKATASATGIQVEATLQGMETECAAPLKAAVAAANDDYRKLLEGIAAERASVAHQRQQVVDMAARLGF